MSFGRRAVRPLGGILLSLALLSFACSSEEEYAPSDCARSKPPTGYLKVKLTVNNENRVVPITVFLGDFEEDQVVARDSLDVAIGLFELPVDEYYSVAARYVVGGDTTLALDGDRIETSSTEYVDAECWSVQDGEVDVRLR